MKTCAPHHQKLKKQGYARCIHCNAELNKPQVSYDTASHRFVKDGVFITEADAKAAWDETASCDWSVKAFNVMASLVMLHQDY